MLELSQSTCNLPCGPVRKEEKFMAVLLGYFDESGKFKDHSVVSYCGIVATFEWWDRFNQEWEYLLRHYGLTAIHMSEGILNFKRGLSAKHPALGEIARLAVLERFIRAIKEHCEFGVSYSVDVSAFRKLSSEAQRKLGGDPYYLAFHSVMGACVDHLKDTGRPNISLVCDDEEKYGIASYRLLNRLKLERPDMRKSIVSFCLADDKHFYGLQGADIMAYVSRTEAETRFCGNPTHKAHAAYQQFVRVETKDRINFKAAFWGEEHLTELAEGIVRKKKRKPLNNGMMKA